MKAKILFVLFLLGFQLSFAQMYFESEWFHDEDAYYFNVKAVYQVLPKPYFISSPQHVKMMLARHNLFVARIDNAILLYDFETKQLDTLFFVYPDTKISQPFWSPNFDRVAFLIYNPRKAHNYTTKYRFIILTLDHNRVIKKEKYNVESVDWSDFDVTTPVFYEDSEMRTNSDSALDANTVRLGEDTLWYETVLEGKKAIVLSNIHGIQQVNLFYEYQVNPETFKVEKFKYLYKMLDFGGLYFDRYLCIPNKIIDLRTGRSLIFPDPPYYMANWSVQVGNKIAVFIPADKEYRSLAKGYIYVVNPDDFSYKKFYVEGLVVHAFNVYWSTLKAIDSHTLEYKSMQGNREVRRQLRID